MSEPITLYDIARKVTAPEDNAWSPNTWKVRYALNIKCIPYKTVWVELPDIEPLCKQLGAPPGGQRPGPLYTLPVIYDPNTKRHIADSSTIVRYLDDAYPSAPRLFPEGTDALHAAFQHALQAVLFSGSGALVTIMRPVTYSALSPGRVQEYFTKTREEWFGKLDDVGPRGSPKHQGAWKELEDAFRTVAGWLVVSTTDSDGKERLFFGGDDTIIFADVTVAGFLKCLQVMHGQDSEEWQGVLRWGRRPLGTFYGSIQEVRYGRRWFHCGFGHVAKYGTPDIGIYQDA